MTIDFAHKEEVADAHDELAELHEFLARTSRLDVFHEAHADMAERLRQEAKYWREMTDEHFASRMGIKAAVS